MAPTQQSGDGDRPRVPDGRRVYAVGDVHGRADLLSLLHGRIEADARGAPEARKVLVYLGDYVDRGPNSFAVVETLIQRPLAGFHIVHLKGNHEDFLLRFLDDPSLAEIWLMNGAAATLLSYGVDVYDPATGASTFEGVRHDFAASLPAHHLAFFRRLHMCHVEGDYAFVHAGVRPGVPLDGQRDDDLLWIRDPFLDSDRDFGKVVVHGHTVDRDPVQRANRIGIDTGACFTGCLTCLVLEGAGRRFLQT